MSKNDLFTVISKNRFWHLNVNIYGKKRFFQSYFKKRPSSQKTISQKEHIFSKRSQKHVIFLQGIRRYGQKKFLKNFFRKQKIKQFQRKIHKIYNNNIYGDIDLKSMLYSQKDIRRYGQNKFLKKIFQKIYYIIIIAIFTAILAKPDLKTQLKKYSFSRNVDI